MLWIFPVANRSINVTLTLIMFAIIPFMEYMGQDADILVLDKDYNIKYVIIDGEIK